MIVVDGSFQANNGQTLGTDEVIEFTVKASAGGGGGSADKTAPAFAPTYPKAANLQTTQFDLLVQTNENGKAYYIVLTNDAAAPTAAEVKAGSGATVLKAGQLSLTKDTEASVTLTGLTAGTAYDVYVVAEDDVPNLQAAPAKIDVTTVSSVPTVPATNAAFTDTDTNAGEIGGNNLGEGRP